MDRRTKSRIARLAALPVALLVSSATVLVATQATYNTTTANSGNSWAAGSVTLTDDDTGAAMFSATDLLPNDTGTRCIAVTYTGTRAADVRFYAAASGTLGTYLNMTVERGSGGNFTSCTGFTPAATIYSGTLANLATTHNNFATGAGNYAVTAGAAQTSVFRITYTVANNDAAMNQNASATFTWEAQTTF